MPSDNLKAPLSPAVQVRHLHKKFGDLSILKDISFDVSPGEMVCVWGPSGAGKSTLLHVLGLMTPPTEGEVKLFGEEIRGKKDTELSWLRNERIGFLFQFHHLLPDLTLLENVMIPLIVRRVPWAEAEGRARPLLEKLGLGKRIRHRPTETSGGEQQRAALARALIGEPGLLLADEPTGNLDRGIGEDVEKLLRNEVKSRGTALVLVTHNEALAAQADRRLVMIDGKLQTSEERQ